MSQTIKSLIAVVAAVAVIMSFTFVMAEQSHAVSKIVLKPKTPTNVTLKVTKGANKQSVNVKASWNKVACTGYVYEITVRNAKVQKSTSNTSVSFNAPKGSTIKFRVCSVSGNKTSEWSKTVMCKV